MALIVNARFLTQPMSGVQRYARELLTALDRRLTTDPQLAARIGPVAAFYPAGAGMPDAPDWARIRISPLSGGGGHYWEQVTLARAVRGHRLLSLCGAGPLAQRDQILIIHDANVFDLPWTYAPAYRMFHRPMRRWLAARVAGLCTVSHAAARALEPHLGVGADRFAIIPNSADHVPLVAPDPGTLARYGLCAGQYLLTVGNQSPNKNIARLVAAHAGLPDRPVLAIAGGFAPGVVAETIGAAPQVRLLGRVSDGELRSLYAGALGFVWPSQSEGFGIPPLEAMALGVPVLSSDTTAMPEVLGDAAAYFAPDDITDIAAKLAAFLRMAPDDRQGMILRGYARARHFSWDASVDRLIAALESPGRAALSVRSALEIGRAAPGDIDTVGMGGRRVHDLCQHQTG